MLLPNTDKPGFAEKTGLKSGIFTPFFSRFIDYIFQWRGHLNFYLFIELLAQPAD